MITREQIEAKGGVYYATLEWPPTSKGADIYNAHKALPGMMRHEDKYPGVVILYSLPMGSGERGVIAGVGRVREGTTKAVAEAPPFYNKDAA